MNITNCSVWWCDQHQTVLGFEIAVIVLSFIGSFGNILTLLAICFSSLRYNVNCVLIGSLSLAGFLYCSLILPLEAAIFHQKTHSISEEFCSAAGGIRYTLVGVILIHLGIIALYRYLNVVHLPQYLRLSNKKPLIVTLAIGWILPLIFTIPAAFRLWGSFTFVPAILACTFSKEGNQSNRIATVTLGFIVPCIFIIFCYIRIGAKAYRISKRVSQPSGGAAWTKALRLSAMMMCIFAVYFLGTFPYFIVNITDQDFSAPIHHLWTTFLGWTFYCTNPIIYTVMDRNFRMAYKKFLSCQCEKNPVRRVPTLTRV